MKFIVYAINDVLDNERDQLTFRIDDEFLKIFSINTL